jgi:hypothetical protein
MLLFCRVWLLGFLASEHDLPASLPDSYRSLQPLCFGIAADIGQISFDFSAKIWAAFADIIGHSAFCLVFPWQ